MINNREFDTINFVPNTFNYRKGLNRMALGTILKNLLEVNNLSQKKMASDLNISPSTLGNYIRSIMEPDFDTLVSFANYFGVTTDFLLEHKTYNSVTTENDEEMLLYLYRNMSDINKKNYLDMGKVLIKNK